MASRKAKDEKRRAARLRTNAKHLQKEVEELDDELPVEEDDDSEPLTKEYYLEAVMVEPNGPTSWSELDAMKDAQEKAEQVREVTWNVQDLVRNIIVSAMPATQKAKAIAAVGSGFEERVKQAEKHEKMEKEFDMELLELTAVLARDARHTSFIEKASDYLSTAFSSPDPQSKSAIRKQLKNAIANIESDGIRESIPLLLKSAKDAGIGQSNTVLIEKDASGNWRAVLWPTNNFMDRDGEIVSEAAHSEYVEWVNKNMDCAPVFATWHKPGTARTNPMDFVGYENGFMIASAPLTEGEAARIFKMQAKVDLGLSIGAVALERDGNIITKYRMFEVSDLPLEKAANPFTEIELISKEAQMDMKQYLSEMLGDEKRAESILEKMALTQSQLRKEGVTEKEAVPAPVADQVIPAPADMDSVVKLVFEKVAEELDLEGLNDYLTSLQESTEKVPVLEALVKELAQDHSEKLAEMIDPPAAKTLVWQKQRASASDKTVLKDDNADDKVLKEAKPELGWLSQATGTQPVNM